MPMRNRPQVYVVANGYLLSMFYSNRNDNSEGDVFKKKHETSTTPSCSGPIPTQKSRANSVPGAIFSTLMFEMNFYYFHRFSWEKIH